jgi:hypothetical protein
MPPETIPTEIHSTLLSDLLVKVLIFLQRPAIQIQLLGIAGSMLLAWLLTRWIWSKTRRRVLLRIVLAGKRRQQSLRRAAIALAWKLSGPSLALIGLYLIRSAVLSQGWKVGLLSVAISLVCVYFAYQVGLGLLYLCFYPPTIQRYHVRLFRPLLILFVLGTTFSLSIDLIPNQVRRTTHVAS